MCGWLQEFARQYDFPVVSIPPFVCFDVSNATASTIPPKIVFHLQSVCGAELVDFVLYGENVLLPSTETGVLCLSILLVLPGIPIIIGNTEQADHEMVFDRANREIGWASTKCT